MPAALMLHMSDPREELRKKIGSVDDVEIFHNQVLVAVYKRPEKTAGGIILTDKNRDEDKYQGKVGLILKLGPSAFKPGGDWTWPEGIGVGDWVFFRTSDSWSCVLNGDHENDCRIVDDTAIRGRIQHPDQVW